MCGEYVGDPFSVEIKDEIVHLSWPDGSERHVPLRVFRIDHCRAGKVLAAYDAHKAVVVPFKRGARRKIVLRGGPV